MAYSISNPAVAADFYFVAPLFDPGASAGGLAATAGARPVSVARVEFFLSEAEKRVDRDQYGDSGGLAVVLQAAHDVFEDLVASGVDPVATTAAAAGYAGPITSEAMGPISRSFSPAGGQRFTRGGAGAFAGDPLGTSPWGQRLIALRRQKVFGRGVA